MKKKDIELYRKLQDSPISYAEVVWGLTPQPIKEEYKEKVEELISKEWNEWEEAKKEFKVEWFIKKTKHEIVDEKLLTWHQWLVLIGVEKAMRGEASKKLSIASGRGIGKTTALSILILWGLFRWKDAQIACTAPTSQQMYDILWKELSLWIQKMPDWLKSKYVWSSTYVRIDDSPGNPDSTSTWFASAKTGKKESPEALAGVHGEFVMLIGDEASGIPDSIFKTAEEGLTEEQYLFIITSNYRRLTGFFHDTRKRFREYWQNFTFLGEDSPIRQADKDLETEKKYGRDSDEYRVEVLGLPPNEEGGDDKGYFPLLSQSDLKKCPDTDFISPKRMGIDPSGEGDDETVWVVRDQFKAKIVCKEKISTSKTIAQKTLTLMDVYGIQDKDIYCDNFGVGANVAQELGLAGVRINAVNVGEPPRDKKRYLNKRAEAYRAKKDWIRGGGEFIGEGWEDLLSIRYRAELSGKMKIMGKLEMKKEGYSSPNVADATMLTFVEPIVEPKRHTESYLDSEIEFTV